MGALTFSTKYKQVYSRISNPIYLDICHMGIRRGYFHFEILIKDSICCNPKLS